MASKRHTFRFCVFVYVYVFYHRLFFVLSTACAFCCAVQGCTVLYCFMGCANEASVGMAFWTCGVENSETEKRKNRKTEREREKRFKSNHERRGREKRDEQEKRSSFCGQNGLRWVWVWVFPPPLPAVLPAPPCHRRHRWLARGKGAAT